MKCSQTIRALIVSAVLLGATSASAQLYHEPQAHPDMGPPAILSSVGVDQKLDHQVPLDLKFRDENNQPVTLGQYFGKKPVLLAMVYYTCPMMCPEILNGMAGALMPVRYDVGKDYDVIVVSIDPKDTAREAFGKKKLTVAHYGRTQTANGWHFLTGEETQIKALADAVGFKYAYDPKFKQYAHSSVIELLTPEGKVAKYFFGIDFPSKDIQLAIVEASQGKVGTTTDQFLLYCFHYDPSTNRYSLRILRVVQFAGALTAMLLGGFIFVMVRREKRT